MRSEEYTFSFQAEGLRDVRDETLDVFELSVRPRHASRSYTLTYFIQKCFTAYH